MNRIIIKDDKVLSKKIDNSIELKEISKKESLDVNIIKISVLKDTDLSLEFESNNSSIELNIDVAENKKITIYEYKKGNNNKFGYNIKLNKNSSLNYLRLNDTKNNKEMLEFNMNGINARLDYQLKTISTTDESYEIMVYHNYSKTISNIYNNGVNIKDGILKFHVSGFIPKGKKECQLSHNNRIINLTNNICEIKPKLFIDENDVVANHSAHIGRCPDDEIFYMMSRGLRKKDAENLWIKGFLLKDMPNMQDKIEDLIKKYWR